MIELGEVKAEVEVEAESKFEIRELSFFGRLRFKWRGACLFLPIIKYK
jgi:hypothetical protein